MIVYKTTNLINGKIYVGQTISENDEYFGSGMKIKLAIKKYGKENFTRETICECETQDELDEMERYWIDKLDSKNRSVGYNISDGGTGGSTAPLSNDWVENMKLAKQKNPVWNKGKRFGPMSEEEKEKRRVALKGKKRPPFSEEWCENISKGKLGCEPWNKGVPWDKPRQWINNGKRDKLILIEEREIYPDWEDGRHFFTRKPAHRGRVWVNKDGETKMIEKDNVDRFLSDGWNLGRNLPKGGYK